MAHGVKYRLQFADVRGIGKRIDILKKNYSGSILPMVCGSEPAVIEWKSDDDVYEPLIGSSCDINLIVTDTVSYDNFYEYDEREYKVQIYFESNTGVYSLYWAGFVTNDIYSEAMTTTPYPITIRAIDGLGSLEGFNTWIPAVGTADATLWEFIYKNLQNLNLDFDIWISNDIRISSSGSWLNVFKDVTVAKEAAFQDSYIINNAKEMLRSILLGFNCKMFQAYGRWVIVNSSSYGDQRIIEGIQNGTYTGSGILAAKQAFLNGGSENIKFYVFNSSGFETGNVTDSFLRIAPNYFEPINNNLVREIKRPVKKYQEKVDISQQRLDLNKNASFEFDFENWAVDLGTYGIGTEPFAGLKALTFIETTNNTATRTLKFHSTDTNAIMVQGGRYQFMLSVRMNNQATTNRQYWWVKLVGGSSGNTWYWDNANKGWNLGTTERWNTYEVTNQNKFQSFKSTMENVPEYGVATIGIGVPYVNPVGSHVNTIIDNLAIRYLDDEINIYKTALFVREQATTSVTTDVLEHKNVYQANLPTDVFWGSFKNIDTYRRAQDSSNRTLEEIVTQQRLNDARSYSKSYEGDLYGNYGYLVLTMMNKVWFNFANMQETDSAIMDSMRYSVKANTYSIKCHIPNNYTDVASNYRVSFQEK